VDVSKHYVVELISSY